MKNLLSGIFFLVVLVAVASGCVSDGIVGDGVNGVWHVAQSGT
jgi:hypothetical protein